VIGQLKKSPNELTVHQVLEGISRGQLQYNLGFVNQVLDDLVVEGLAVKAESRGHCRYRWASFRTIVELAQP
jgi:hypothetical protein